MVPAAASTTPLCNSLIPMFMDEPVQEENIRVCLRLRPINKLEESRRSHNCVTVYRDTFNDNNEDDIDNSTNSIKVDSPLEGKFEFTFDRVFSEDSSQQSVYCHAVAPLASDFLDGFNCALIAYGQTGSGKTYTMMGRSVGSRGVRARHHASLKEMHVESSSDESDGMIHRLIKDIFRLIADSPPTVEYIIRCSFVEIYLEKILDLLNPVNHSIRIHFDRDTINNEKGIGSHMSGSDSGGVHLEGASEACCFDVSDIISLLVRGNASRTVSSTKMNTDSSRSHAIFRIKLEQKDSSTGISKLSQLQLIDMAGSELGGKNLAVLDMKGSAIHQEAKMINRSLALLNSVVKAVVANQDHFAGKNDEESQNEIPYSQSKLTQMLRDAFGGNCRTSIILTVSPASYNIAESIRTMKFGSNCRSVLNRVKPSVEMSPVDYRKLLNVSQKKQGDLIELVNELSAECFQLRHDAKHQNFVESNYNGPLWQKVEAIFLNGAAPVLAKPSRARIHPIESSDMATLREELMKVQDELDNSKKARDFLENVLAERKSEVAVLRTQNDNYSAEKKKNYQELISAKNEIRLLTQRKQEVEHNLRTSQFREYEATVFLRQFRRFYRRLLKNKATQGTGGTSEVIEKVPGVPDLNDLIDVDSLLLESGLIEESELHDDTATGAYRPSAQALGRSTEASNKAWKEAAARGKVEELTALDRTSSESRKRSVTQVEGNRNQSEHVSEAADGEVNENTSGADAGAGSTRMPYGQTITNRQQFLGTPAGRLTTMRERELERDLLRATERCIELQVALNEEKANVDVLTNRAGNVNKKKFAQETIQLKQQLDKKTHDLQAIIWKMNELHLINKTYNEKMSNREQHVTYLEENLIELQSSNRNMILERQEAEDKLREELENLKVLVDAMTIPLWQFGECGITSRTLASRIRLCVQGGEYSEEDRGNISGDESLGSVAESAVSEEEKYSDAEKFALAAAPNESVIVSAIAVTAQAEQNISENKFSRGNNVPMRDASTQSAFSSQEKGTMTDLSDITTTSLNSFRQTNPVERDVSSNDTARTFKSLPVEPSNNSSTQDREAGGNMIQMNSAQSTSLTATDGNSSNGLSSRANAFVFDNDTGEPDSPQVAEDIFRGGKPTASHPRRFVPKFGLMIRPGVLKESLKAKESTISRSKS